MRLHVFAHKKEAEAFLDHSNCQSIDNPFGLAYKNELGMHFICGEGLQKSAIAFALFISDYKDQIQMILNFGIVGSLRDHRHFEIVSVRNVFSERSPYSMEQKSFVLDYKLLNMGPSKYVDCISAYERVLDPNYAQKLQAFADIVDRELWALANVSAKLNIPLLSLKIISDQAGQDSHCQQIQDISGNYSHLLLQHYLENGIQNPEVNHKNDLLVFSDLKKHDLFFTYAQKNILQQLFSKHNISDLDQLIQCLGKEKLEPIFNSKEKPKIKTKLLIECFERWQNPILAKFQDKLELWKSENKLDQQIAKINIDIERAELQISSIFKSKQDKMKFINELEKLNMDELVQMLNGNF